MCVNGKIKLILVDPKTPDFKSIFVSSACATSPHCIYRFRWAWWSRRQSWRRTCPWCCVRACWRLSRCAGSPHFGRTGAGCTSGNRSSSWCQTGGESGGQTNVLVSLGIIGDPGKYHTCANHYARLETHRACPQGAWIESDSTQLSEASFLIGSLCVAAIRSLFSDRFPRYCSYRMPPLCQDMNPEDDVMNVFWYVVKTAYLVDDELVCAVSHSRTILPHKFDERKTKRFQGFVLLWNNGIKIHSVDVLVFRIIHEFIALFSIHRYSKQNKIRW